MKTKTVPIKLINPALEYPAKERLQEFEILIHQFEGQITKRRRINPKEIRFVIDEIAPQERKTLEQLADRVICPITKVESATQYAFAIPSKEITGKQKQQIQKEIKYNITEHNNCFDKLTIQSLHSLFADLMENEVIKRTVTIGEFYNLL